MNIPTPQELGFPPKFDQWRPAQLEALRLLLNSKKRVKALDMPVGGGKSAVYVAYALLTRRKTVFVTESLGLMEQLYEDFKGVGMVQLKGRRRYDCDLKPDYTCEDGKSARCPNLGGHLCELSAAEFAAQSSFLVVTNYDKWTSARKFGIALGNTEQVVFDEGHLAHDALARAMQVTLRAKEIEDSLGIDFPAGDDEMVNWKQWAVYARAEAENELAKARTLVQQYDPKPAHVRRFNHLTHLVRRLATISTCRPENWIVDTVENGYQFDPVRVGRYSEAALLLRVPSIVVTSGTLRRKSLFDIGVSSDIMDFWDFPSEFNPKDCPIYYIPTMAVNFRNTDLTQLWMRHDQIAARRRDRKSITHTISFVRAGQIQSHSRFADSMILNEKGEPSTDTVEMFKQAPREGTILVSPSVGAGFDFPGPLCEWQFVCKVPFPDTRSKIVRARQEADPEYGPAQAAMKLQQIFGRGARFKGDRCENFIADDSMSWFVRRYGHLFSKSFHKFYRQLDILPAPPERM